MKQASKVGIYRRLFVDARSLAVTNVFLSFHFPLFFFFFVFSVVPSIQEEERGGRRGLATRDLAAAV